MSRRWDIGSTTPKKSSEILDFWKRLWDTIWSFLDQYFSFRVKWGLYEHLRVTARPTRPKLVDITASRDLFRVIFVPRDPRDNSEVSVLTRSFCHNTLDWDVFLSSDDSENPWECANTVSETENEPSYVGIGQKLTSVDQKVSMTLVRSFPTLWVWILKSSIQTSNG